jgi:hypothetical protein
LGIKYIDLQGSIWDNEKMSKNKPHGVLTLEEAKLVLAPLVPTLLDSFWESWNWTSEWIAKDEKAKLILHSSTMAGIVSDAFGHFARPKLITEFSASWSSRGRFHRAIIGQSVSLRFKKLLPDLNSMNIQTEEQRSVYEQHEARLPNARRITAITLGYTLRKMSSKPSGVYFVCPQSFERNSWTWPIYQESDGQLQLFTPPSLPPDQPVEDVLDVNINLKSRKKERA